MLMTLIIASITPIEAQPVYAFDGEPLIFLPNGDKVILEAGWHTNPAIQGELNKVVIRILEITSTHEEKPIPDVLANLDLMIVKDQSAKKIHLRPQKQVGLYAADIIPTDAGQYSLLLKGQIENKTVDGALPLNDVVERSDFLFPPIIYEIGPPFDPMLTGSDKQQTSNVNVQKNVSSVNKALIPDARRIVIEAPSDCLPFFFNSFNYCGISRMDSTTLSIMENLSFVSSISVYLGIGVAIFVRLRFASKAKPKKANL
jgi:hypothetical protein